MSNLAYVLARIDEGSRVRLAMDYFGQSIAVVPRRWLPGTRRINLDPSDAKAVERALRNRRQVRRLQEEASPVRS